MDARRDFHDRDTVEVEVLEALIERHQAGMTIFELRSCVDADIETLEPALGNLRNDGLITVEYGDERSIIRPEERILPQSELNGEDEWPWDGIFSRIRRLFSR